MSAVVGIDLGTTNTVIACVRDGRVHVLADEKGNRLLPSVVSFRTNGEVLVGASAKLRRLNDAKNTIASIKRLIGRPWDSDEIRLARSRFAFELREGPGQGALVIARGEAYTLPEISAFVLKRARQIAEAALGETVDRAVITVPAHFNELQRASTKVAGRVAGLEVLRILNEPTAAALAYGFGSSANERVAVYDYGGGTFDCSLLELSGNLYEVLATAGDTFLGGDDIDGAIAEQMCSAFLLQHRYDPRADPQAFEKLRAAAENLKIELSANPQAQVDLKDVAYGIGGRQLGLTFAMTQADLDALAEPFVERTLQVTQDALNTARLSQGSFDRIVLVGGSTRMPLVKRRVEAFFGMAVMDRVNPDEVVAIGAAIQASALAEGASRSLPPPPMPGVLRAAQAGGAGAMRSTGNLGATAVDSMVNPERKLPSIAPNSPSSPPPPNAPPRRTLRPGQGARESAPPPNAAAGPPSETLPGPGGANAKDDSMSYANTMPGNQASPIAGAAGARLRGDARPPANTMASAHADPSIATRGGNTLSSDVEYRERSIAEPPSITGSPAALRPAQLAAASRSRPPPAMAPPSRSRPPPAAPPPRSSPPPATQADPYAYDPPISSQSQGFGGEAGPLPTDDISLIVPDATGMRHGSDPGDLDIDTDTGDGAGPLPTEDISLIAPDHGASRGARPFPPMSRMTGSMLTSVDQPGPLPTEDISLIAPEPMSMANRTQAGTAVTRTSVISGGTLGSPGQPALGPSGKRSHQDLPAYAPPTRQGASPYAAPPPAAVPSQRNPLAYPMGRPPAGPPPIPQSARETQDAPQIPLASKSSQKPPSLPFGAPAPAPYAPPQAPMADSTLSPPYQPPVPVPAGDPRAQAGWKPQLAPVLVDVTPRALVVEVVGGFSDTVIARNATIPCEHTRVFATGRDQQTTVHVRIGQGESQKFAENTYLGELELSGLRAATRGEVTLSVTFELDADGSLQVRAVDTSSGKEARATMRLIAVAQDEEQIEEMIERSRSVSVHG